MREIFRGRLGAIAALLVGFLLGVIFCCATGKKFSPAPAPAKQIVQVLPPVDFSQAQAPAPAPSCQTRKHVVNIAAEPTLWAVAKAEYGGRGYLYPLIAEKNNLKARRTRNLMIGYTLKDGQVLYIPCCLCDLPALVTTTVVHRKVQAKRKRAEITVHEVIPETPPTSPTQLQVQAETAPPPPAPTPAIVQQSVVVVQSPPVPAPPPVSPAPQVAPPAPAPQPPPAAQQQVPAVVAQVAPPQQPPAKPATVEPPPAIPKVPFAPAITGSAWDTLLTTPLERGNVIDYAHVDLGVVFAHIGKVQFEPYVATNVTKDTKGNSWDNRIEGEAGLKLIVPLFGHGLITFNSALADERRGGTIDVLHPQERGGLINYTSAWFGWNQPTARASEKKIFHGAFPGTFQWTIGNVSAYERNNLIGDFRADQGIVLGKFGHVSFIPMTWFQIGRDTQDHFWNNRYTYGGGMKIALPWTKGVSDVRVGYECAEQYRGPIVAGASGCGVSFHLDFWTGARKEIR